MRLSRVVARAALIAVLASVVVPGLAGSRIPGAPAALDPTAFHDVDLARSVTTMTMFKLDPTLASEGGLAPGTQVLDPDLTPGGTFLPRPIAPLPSASPITKVIWHYDPEISWYGPGFYGNGGACGMIPGGLTPETVGVAHRTLPCGTKVTFRYKGVTVTTRVIDRGPYVAGRTWDMTRGLCVLLNHCFTGGGVYYKIG